ncbi:hypothetical protein [Cochlodiniinecator piscidefendens]|uniref:hypothetical protein n=1 Tax=Cochlodiniinecator piscidefendens TaxID=2715756 RepID=UPI0014072DD9|nr:hypothetical protein [Cochlodiniinecator piscidefendens]
MIKQFFFSLFLAVPVVAQTPLTPEEFQDLTEGRTFFFESDNVAYGAEEYLPGRRVRWSFLDGRCIEGGWVADLDLICFVYDGWNEAQCWSFYYENGQLRGHFENDNNTPDLLSVADTDEPLLCVGPDVGA